MHLFMVAMWPFFALVAVVSLTLALVVAWVFITLGWYTLQDNKIKFGRNPK
jgi:uncharacterized membrane protein YhaH (DUF805 family)